MNVRSLNNTGARDKLDTSLHRRLFGRCFRRQNTVAQLPELGARCLGGQYRRSWTQCSAALGCRDMGPIRSFSVPHHIYCSIFKIILLCMDPFSENTAYTRRVRRCDLHRANSIGLVPMFLAWANKARGHSSPISGVHYHGSEQQSAATSSKGYGLRNVALRASNE